MISSREKLPGTKNLVYCMKPRGNSNLGMMGTCRREKTIVWGFLDDFQPIFKNFSGKSILNFQKKFHFALNVQLKRQNYHQPSFRTETKKTHYTNKNSASFCHNSKSYLFLVEQLGFETHI